MFLKEADSGISSPSSEMMCLKNGDLNVSRVCELDVSKSGKQGKSITRDTHCRLEKWKKIMEKPKICGVTKEHLYSVIWRAWMETSEVLNCVIS